MAVVKNLVGKFFTFDIHFGKSTKIFYEKILHSLYNGILCGSLQQQQR